MKSLEYVTKSVCKEVCSHISFPKKFRTHAHCMHSDFLFTFQVFSSLHCKDWTRFHLGPDGLLHYIHDFITKDKAEFCVDSYEEEEQYNSGDYDYNVRDLERNTGKVGRSKSNLLWFLIYRFLLIS